MRQGNDLLGLLEERETGHTGLWGQKHWELKVRPGLFVLDLPWVKQISLVKGTAGSCEQEGQMGMECSGLLSPSFQEPL